ncbi:MAG: PH domain-containing protein [bacterium]
MLVATQKRLLFVHKGILFGLKVEDFPLDKISSIQYQTGLLVDSITVFSSGNKAVIRNIEKDRTRTFTEGVRARIELKRSGPPPSLPTPVSTPLDLMTELEKLGSLRERGLCMHPTLGRPVRDQCRDQLPDLALVSSGVDLA